MLRYFLLFLSLLTVLLAQSNPQTIDSQIEQIKRADPSERVRLMNEFKLRVSQMNQTERSLAIKSMQSKMRKESRNEMKDRTAKMQMQHNENISHYQNMNQYQAGQQMINEGSIEHSSFGAGKETSRPQFPHK